MSHEPLNLPEDRQGRVERANAMDDGQIAAGADGSALPQGSPPEMPDSFWALLHEWRLAHREWEVGGPKVTRGELDRIADRMRAVYSGRVSVPQGGDPPELGAAHEMWKALSTLKLRHPEVPIEAAEDLISKFAALRGSQPGALRAGPPGGEPEELDEFAETRAGVRAHIAKFWKDGGPNQKIKLSLPRWLWDKLLARTMRAGPPGEPSDEELEIAFLQAHAAAITHMTKRGLGAKTRRVMAGRKAGIAAIGRLIRRRSGGAATP